MSLDHFAPLSTDEVEIAAASKPSSAKRPIVPVPKDAPACSFRHPEFGAPVKLWAYRDAGGALLSYDARFEYEADGKRHKDVLPLTYCEIGDKRGWRAKAMPAARALYGLDRLAQRPDAPVIVVEGCKCADAAGELLPDYVAVTWSGGSKAVSQSSWTPLRGRTVLIWPDRDRHCELDGTEKSYDDQPGAITADAITEKLKGVAAEIQVLDLADWDCADGWDAADALVEGWTPERTTAFVAERARLIDLDAPGTVMPYQFENGLDGLYHVETETKRARLCGRLKVLAKTRDQAGGGWGLLMEWRDDDGQRHLWAMPKSMLAGDGSAIRETLLEQGLFVNTASAARSKLLQFLSAVDTPVRARAVGKVGWSGSCFVLPHTTIGDTPTERVIFQQAEAPPHQYSAAGTLADWQERVAALAVGNTRLIFSISTAFVGPVLAPALEEGGGFNLVGPSSCGKTTCMAAAVSVWGPPKFMRTWRATGNGLEGIAAQHSETFLALDELGQLDPNEAGHVAYMLTNGQGKQRASRSGGGRAAATWSLVYLSTGEIGLADLVRQGKRDRTPAAGQEVRILDLPADAGKGMGAFEQLNGGASMAEAFSRLIKTGAAEAYGVAADAYLRALTERRAEVGDLVARVVRNFTQRYVPADADGQVARGARRFALVAAAGELATLFGILPWDKGAAYTAAATMFHAWLGRRGGTGSAEDRNIISQVRAFFEAHGETRFDPAEPDERSPRPVFHRAGFWKDVQRPDGGYEREHWVMSEAFREICKGHDHDAVVKTLAGTGALKTWANGRPSVAKRLPGIGVSRVYVIGPRIFEAEE